MNRMIFALTLTLLPWAWLPSALLAQANSHERLGVEKPNPWEMTLESGLTLYPIETELGQGLEAEASLSGTMLFRGRFSLTADLPLSLRAPLSGADLPSVAIGDPRLGAGYLVRRGAWRFSCELSYTYPAGIWESYEAEERRIVSGSGFHLLRGAISAIRYLDPLVAGLKLTGETGFGRKEQFGTGSRPFSLFADLFATEALNGAAAFSIGLSQRWRWPRRVDGRPTDTGVRYSASLGLSFVFSAGDRSLRIGLSRSLDEEASPASLDLGCSWTYRKKE